jgi:hypothetical protein
VERESLPGGLRIEGFSEGVMDELKKPPQWLINLLPEARGFLEGGGWLAVLGVGGLLILLLLWLLLRGLLGGGSRRKPRAAPRQVSAEDLQAIPPPPPHSGDLRLTVEGLPMRLRLVVVAPAGTAYTIDPDRVPEILDQVVPGLGEALKRDEPQTRIWPGQLSYEGFANTFHRSTPVPEGEKNPSRWAILAGRADLEGHKVLVGLALQAVRPNSVGRRTLKGHEWATVLRVKVLES